MNKISLILCILSVFYDSYSSAQIKPENITIARDSWGVPHIFAPTDGEVAYGLAWANAEDDFASILEHVLASKGRLAEVKGKDGAVMDVLMHLIGAQELVDTAYREDTYSPQFNQVLEGYLQGLNDYARTHPKEIPLKDIFPLKKKDLVKAYVLGFSIFCGLDREITRVFNGQIKADEEQLASGSNAIAIAPSRTQDGQTYLAINSHQPLEGPFSWYEAHLCSDEGWNILGGTLPGFLSIGHGVNENLGWAHTVNYPDFIDIYKLEMHPERPLEYKFDGEWKKLLVRPVKIKVKVGPLKIAKKFEFYWSVYGATLKKDDAYYAIRFPANMQIKAPEQQYHMNKARNFEEFYAALNKQYLPSFNIVYADKTGNIFYLNNGLIPYRSESYNWRLVLPGDTSATLWPASYYPLKELPQVLNPKSGYVFNTNNTPFNATAPADNLNPANYHPNMGHLRVDNNRSLRFQELIGKYGKLSYEDFKTIKYDITYPSPMYFYFAENIEDVFQLKPEQYPDISEMIRMIQSWDRKNNLESETASIFMIFLKKMYAKIQAENRVKPGNRLSTEEMVEALRASKTHLLKYFKTIQVPLAQLQRHQRGKTDLGMAGAFDVLAAMFAQPTSKGRFRTSQGESYILMARFSNQGVMLESVNAYGTSNHKTSPHYTDQMPLYVDKKLKKMLFNKEEILKTAARIYHPME
ncbi:MAG: penicillin acylase family protein [Microscillaceae bacterium]|nr:penicillin acylase family protein [Microscillaceae bacterium]